MISYGFSLSCDTRGLLFGFLSHSLEVLTGESDQVLRMGSDDFLGEVFEDSWEVLGHLNLIGGENSHLTNVCHFP